MKLRRNDEMDLPLYATSDRQKSFSLLRWWRSVPRLKRSVILMVLIFGFLILAMMRYTTQTEEISIEDKRDFKEAIENQNENFEKAQEPGNKEAIENQEPVLKEPRKNVLSQFKGPENDRQRAVVRAFKHGWDGYKKYAWGHDQLKPISKGYSDWFDTSLTLIDGLDTAMIMGLHEEVADATEYIRDMSFDKNRYVNFFEATIRVLGGLLSAYHLSGDKMFLEKSQDIAERLSYSFKKSTTWIPLSDVNLQSRDAKSPQWAAESSLSEITTVQLEFRDLSRVLNNSTYEDMAFTVSKKIHEIGCSRHEGLCDMYLDVKSGKFKSGTTITFGARADSYYEYLFKQWIQTGKTIDWLREDYLEAMNAMEKFLLRKSQPHNYSFVGELLAGENYSPKMDHLTCFLAGTLAHGTENGMPKSHLDIAKSLAQACHAMYENPTGLGPEIAYYNMLPGSKTDLYIKPLDAHCLLRPEAIEGWFYLYRITKDPIYQEWGWAAFEAIEKHAKVANGYSSVHSVKKMPVGHRDLMESFFLAETLKYLYLLFADDQTILPLDKWVFNTEAHPLPIYAN